MQPDVEIEEWYRNGIVVRRFVNGVETAPDTEPTAIQFADSVITKTYMTKQEFTHKYPGLLTSSME